MCYCSESDSGSDENDKEENEKVGIIYDVRLMSWNRSYVFCRFLIFEKHLIGTLLLFAQSVYFGPYYTSFSRIMSGKSIITGNSSMSRLWTNLHMIILVIRSGGRKKKAEGKRKVYMQDFFQRGGEGVRFQIRLIEFKAI